MNAHIPDTVPESPFEKTYRLVTRLEDSEIDYVKDTAEWISRCVSKVLTLSPMTSAAEITPLVVDMSTRGRWRLMKPELVGAQLVTPVEQQQP